jgi:hypothetical protein
VDTARSSDQTTKRAKAFPRRAVLGLLPGGGLAALLPRAGRDDAWVIAWAQGQQDLGLRSEQPNRFVLAGQETRITYDAAVDGGPRLTYDGPYGSQTFEGDALTAEESALGRLITAYLGAFPDQGELWLTLLLPVFRPMTMWGGPSSFATLAILKWLVSTVAGPPREGALEEYRVLELEGTAEFVATRPEGVAVDEVLGESRIGLPPSVDALALTRIALPPGEAATAVDGSHLFIVESGELTVDEYIVPTDPPIYGVGERFDVRYDETSPAITNEGAEPAVALVISLVRLGGASIMESLPGWQRVDGLALVDPASVDPPLLPTGGSDGGVIAVALVRVAYSAGASAEIPEILTPAAHLLAVESGALDVQVADPALLTPAGGSAETLPSNTRVSLKPGDHLLVPGPGRVSTFNDAAGPASVLFLSLAAAAVATGRR